MTTDAEKLAVMEGAIKHGKKLEGRELPYGEWRSLFYPSWNWDRYDYRLAPERKKAKVWVNVYSDEFYAWNKKEMAERAADNKAIAIAVPVEFEYEEGYGLEDRT